MQGEPNNIAPYFVEEIRQYLEKKYGSEEVHEAGLRVYTSLNLEMQKAAKQAVLDGLAAYERRHGWKGNLLNVVANGESLDGYHHVDWDSDIAPGSYVHALVTERRVRSTRRVKFGRYGAELGPAEIKWTRYTSPQQFLTRGDLVYVKVVELNGTQSRVSLEQESGVQGALLALDNSTGDVKAMVGGRDFEQSKFNRATQALRQVGSSFKPYIYTAAIDQGMTPDDTVLDAPVSFPGGPAGPYVPHNYDGKFEGVITFRHALARVAQHSRAEGDRARRRHQDGHRVRAQVRHHRAAAGVSAGRAGRGRHHAVRADRGLHHVSQRRRARCAAHNPQGRPTTTDACWRRTIPR